MKYEIIPKTNIKISKIGFGTRTFNINIEEAKSRQLIDKIIDEGVNFFCTSANYQEGKVEEKLGEVLSGIRSQVVIATSGGVYHEKGRIIIDSSPNRLEKSIQQSLRNLNTDYLDHFEIHIYDPITELKDTLKFLITQVESNIIKSVGTSCFIPRVIGQWEEYIPTSLIQVPLNPLQTKAYTGALTICKELQIGMLAYSPLFGGLFSQPFDKFPPVFKNLFSPNQKWKITALTIIKELSKLAQQLNKTIPDLVLNWILSRDNITSILVGTNNIDHLIQNSKVIEEPVHSTIINKIEMIIFKQIHELTKKDFPKFNITVEKSIVNSRGECVIICKSGLILHSIKAFDPDTILEIDIETGEIIY